MKKPKIKLPSNVKYVYLLRPSIKKAYHICTAKYMTFDNTEIAKMRNDQIKVYCGHGFGGLKCVKGKLSFSESVNYALICSNNYRKIPADVWGIDINDKRMISIGFPGLDVLIGNKVDEVSKITSKKYKKVILWMPTFRKGGGYKRNDSTKEQPLGIPLFETNDELNEINKVLIEYNFLLIIKIHPKQDLSNLNVQNFSNIVVLTGEDIKKIDVDNYRLMNSCDALISDYSSVAFEFLHLDRPISYVLDDMNEYKLGFVVDDIHTLMAGKEIYSKKDFKDFIEDLYNDNDSYKERRKKLRNYLYDYHDTNSCERLAKLMGL